MNKADPFFSIVVPTRNRAETLLYAVRSCLNQDYDDFEVVVCDNFSTDHTPAVMAQFHSDKIKSVRTDKPLAMSDNWEFALSHARGQMVTILGDDDALLPYALSSAWRLWETTKVPAISWRYAYYLWPNYPVPGEENRLMLPWGAKVRVLQSAETINWVMRRGNHDRLPMIYNSFVCAELLDELRRRTGRVLGGISPDLYTGFAFAFLTPRYLSIDRPLSIAGQSGKSNGAAGLRLAGKSPVAKEFISLYEGSPCRWCDAVPPVTISMWAAQWESKEQAQALLGIKGTAKLPEQQQMLRQIATEVQCHPALSEEERGSWKKNMLDWCGPRHELRSCLLSFFESAGNLDPGNTGWPRRNSLGDDYLQLDGKDFQVQDILGAVQLYLKLFGNRDSTTDPVVIEGLEPKSDVLRNYSPEQLISMLSCREIASALFRRIKNGLRRRLLQT